MEIYEQEFPPELAAHLVHIHDNPGPVYDLLKLRRALERIEDASGNNDSLNRAVKKIKNLVRLAEIANSIRDLQTADPAHDLAAE